MKRYQRNLTTFTVNVDHGPRNRWLRFSNQILWHLIIQRPSMLCSVLVNLLLSWTTNITGRQLGSIPPSTGLVEVCALQGLFFKCLNVNIFWVNRQTSLPISKLQGKHARSCILHQKCLVKSVKVIHLSRKNKKPLSKVPLMINVWQHCGEKKMSWCLKLSYWSSSKLSCR